MTYKIVLERFEGPLDLLLELINEREMEVGDVSLKEVTAQYLFYIEKNDIPPGELADFLSVAVRLLLLKTRALMPFLTTEEEAAEDDLSRQLKIYKAYWEAAKAIDALAKSSKRAFGKPKVPMTGELGFSPPKKKHITGKMIFDIMSGIVASLEEFVMLPKTSLKRVVSLNNKIALLRDFLNSNSRLTLNNFLSHGNGDRTDVIVNFLAVLELVKQNEVGLELDGESVTLVKLI